jgi:hypothetical protein
VVVVGHEDDVMDENLIFFSPFGDSFKNDACYLSLVEPEGPVVCPAKQVVGIFSLYDTERASHAQDKAQVMPKVSDT